MFLSDFSEKIDTSDARYILRLFRGAHGAKGTYIHKLFRLSVAVIKMKGKKNKQKNYFAGFVCLETLKQTWFTGIWWSAGTWHIYTKIFFSLMCVQFCSESNFTTIMIHEFSYLKLLNWPDVLGWSNLKISARNGSFWNFRTCVCPPPHRILNIFIILWSPPRLCILH